jgi:hypothetical protein
MATVYKPLAPEDIQVTRTILNEAIPITGSIISGTYSSSAGETNILNYAHGMFQTVYDYPVNSSSANNLFDITVGLASGSYASASSTNQITKKLSIYNQMASILAGNDVNGGILKFDRDGDPAGGSKINNAYFLNFSRLLFKDQIKKGSFTLELGVTAGSIGSSYDSFSYSASISDSSAQYKTNSPAGEYGILRLDTISGNSGSASKESSDVGLIFYQAGVVVLNTDIFAAYNGSGVNLASNPNGQLSSAAAMKGSTNNYANIATLFATGSIQDAADSLRKRIKSIQFQNTTQLNSTIHFVRINNNEFNYSSNPTYLTGSKIKIKNDNSQNAPLSFITSVGLYSADNELLAVAKLSTPLQKTETDSLSLRVRLDY